VPAAIETTLLAAVPMHLADAPDWELRAVRIAVPGEEWLALQDGRPVS
jgi:hypothetical protein